MSISVNVAARAFSVPIESERRLYFFNLTRFLRANRYPTSPENALIWPPRSAAAVRWRLRRAAAKIKNDERELSRANPMSRRGDRLRGRCAGTDDGADRQPLQGSEMVGATGIEPVTPSMSTRCSPAELRALKPELTGGVRISAPKRGRQGIAFSSEVGTGSRQENASEQGPAPHPRIERARGPVQAASILFTSLTNSRRWTGLGQYLGVFRRLRIRVQGDRGKAGDEHDLDVGVEFRGAGARARCRPFRASRYR